MRKIFLLTVFAVVNYLPTFSQSNRLLQIDTTVVKFGFPTDVKTHLHLHTLSSSQLLKNPEQHKYLLDPNSAEKGVHFGQLLNNKIKALQSLDNMPCLHPNGTFPMPIYKPDSTVRYTLLIKKSIAK